MVTDNYHGTWFLASRYLLLNTLSLTINSFNCVLDFFFTLLLLASCYSFLDSLYWIANCGTWDMAFGSYFQVACYLALGSSSWFLFLKLGIKFLF